MEKRTYILGIVIVIIAIVVAAWALFRVPSGDGDDVAADAEGVAGEPINIALDFYEAWLDTMRATSTDSDTASLIESPVLSQSVRDQLMRAQSDADDEIDPVLCQSLPPDNIAARPVYEQEDEVQFLIYAHKSQLPNQSVVTLERGDNDTWQITAINCSMGESAGDSAAGFSRQGFLLKSVPPPFDPDHWHLVYEENGQMGFTVPLMFDASSVCVLGESEAACDVSQFTETAYVSVTGQVGESGLMVERLEVLE